MPNKLTLFLVVFVSWFMILILCPEASCAEATTRWGPSTPPPEIEDYFEPLAATATTVVTVEPVPLIASSTSIVTIPTYPLEQVTIVQVCQDEVPLLADWDDIPDGPLDPSHFTPKEVPPNPEASRYTRLDSEDDSSK